MVHGRSVCRNGVKESDARSRHSVVSGASSRASGFAFIARPQDLAAETMSRRRRPTPPGCALRLRQEGFRLTTYP